MKTILNLLCQKKHLSQTQSFDFMASVLQGKVSNEDIFNFIQSYDEKGPTAHELVGFIKAMKQNALSISCACNPLIDVCGTGGSNQNRFNISTCVTFVLAAADIFVAKHGNYGSSKPNGSFNFLEEMHIPFQLSSEHSLHLLNETHFCFLFARKYHPGMKYVASARKLYQKRTIFNLLGPLCNPLDVTHQVIGISSNKHIDILVKTAQLLNRDRVLFCLGGDGKDEVSLVGDTYIYDVSPGSVNEYTFNFTDQIDSNVTEYQCGDSHFNAMTFINILLEKDWNHSIIKHICINAAFAMVCVNKVDTVKQGYEYALELFKSEKVIKKINDYKYNVAKLEENIKAF